MANLILSLLVALSVLLYGKWAVDAYRGLRKLWPGLTPFSAVQALSSTILLSLALGLALFALLCAAVRADLPDGLTGAHMAVAGLGSALADPTHHRGWGLLTAGVFLALAAFSGVLS